MHLQLHRDPLVHLPVRHPPSRNGVIMVTDSSLERDIAHLRELTEWERRGVRGDPPQIEEDTGAQRTVYGTDWPVYCEIVLFNRRKW